MFVIVGNFNPVCRYVHTTEYILCLCHTCSMLTGESSVLLGVSCNEAVLTLEFHEFECHRHEVVLIKKKQFLFSHSVGGVNVAFAIFFTRSPDFQQLIFNMTEHP